MRSLIASSPPRRRWLALWRGAVGASARRRRSKTVKQRGALICGVSQGLAGFSIKDDKGDWSGFDVDFCRALAAADLQRSVEGAVRAADGHGAVRRAEEQAGRRAVAQLDLDLRAARAITGSSSPASPITTARRFSFPRAATSPSALELDGSKVCIQNGTTHEPNATDFFETNHINAEVVHGATRRRRRGRLSRRQMQRADDRRVAALRPALAVSRSLAII